MREKRRVGMERQGNKEKKDGKETLEDERVRGRGRERRVWTEEEIQEEENGGRRRRGE